MIKHRTGRMVLAIFFLGFLAGTVCPAWSAAQPVEPDLSKLEIRFFQHDYPKDTIQSRLERLEKLVFGEAKSGSDAARLQSLITLVPGSADSSGQADSAVSAVENKYRPDKTTHTHASHPQNNFTPTTDSKGIADASKYPAVTAIEKRLFGKDYSTEAIGQRLNRLEIKVFGRESGIDDLSERVDRIKQRTGVDIARQAPPGSDWADDDDLTGPPVSSSGVDEPAYDHRDLQRHVQQSFGMRSPSSSWASAYSRAAKIPGGGSGQIPTAPDLRSGRAFLPRPAPSVTGMGLSQSTAALETEIFGRTYSHEPLPTRLNRLESTVFPQDKTKSSSPLPTRVERLLAAVPLSRGQAGAPNLAQRGQSDPDFDDPNQPRASQPRSGGLSKILNSLSSFISGGYTSGYPGVPTNLMTDPQTGMLFDSSTGNLIDPMTGAVVGQRLMPGSSMGSGFGTFNNGFSPYGGGGYGMRSTGLGFGIGGGPRYGFGVWP